LLQRLQTQIVCASPLTALDLHDQVFGLAALVVEKVDVVRQLTDVRSLLVVLGGPHVHKVHRPKLELECRTESA